jgi:hypothetical protein
MRKDLGIVLRNDDPVKLARQRDRMRRRRQLEIALDGQLPARYSIAATMPTPTPRFPDPGHSIVVYLDILSADKDLTKAPDWLITHQSKRHQRYQQFSCWVHVTLNYPNCCLQSLELKRIPSAKSK